jgi:hypothetical protein
VRKNLKTVAKQVERRVVQEGWEPTTAEIQRMYNLTGTQVKAVKDYVKDSFAEQGAVWVYDPKRGNGGFSLAVNVDPAGQKYLRDVDLQHSLDCMGNRDRVFKAGLIAGHLTEAEYAEAGRLIGEAKNTIRSTAHIGWADVEADSGE